MSEAGCDWAEEHLQQCGETYGSLESHRQVSGCLTVFVVSYHPPTQAYLANKHVPTVQLFSNTGERIDSVDYHPGSFPFDPCPLAPYPFLSLFGQPITT